MLSRQMIKAVLTSMQLAVGVLTIVTGWVGWQVYLDREAEKLTPEQVDVVVQDELGLERITSQLTTLQASFVESANRQEVALDEQRVMLDEGQDLLIEHIAVFREQRADINVRLSQIEGRINNPNDPINANNNDNVADLKAADARQDTRFNEHERRLNNAEQNIQELRQAYNF